MRVLVTGSNGQLGQDVVAELYRCGHDAIGIDIADVDITDEYAVKTYICDVHPDAVIHCAAWTAVDAAEEQYEKVMLVNGKAASYIAEVCKALDIKLMYISTDYVFSGTGETPWCADEKDFQPLNIYGKSKLYGEDMIRKLLDKFFVVRIAWVFGTHGNNFVKTMLNVGKNHSQLRIVNDQIGTPTYTCDLAKLLVQMIQTEQYGHYHATNEGGYISWYEFAKEIFKQAAAYDSDYDESHLTICGVSTEEYGLSKAHRPRNSRLDKSELVQNGFELLPTWQDALSRYLKEIWE